MRTFDCRLAIVTRLRVRIGRETGSAPIPAGRTRPNTPAGCGLRIEKKKATCISCDPCSSQLGEGERRRPSRFSEYSGRLIEAGQGFFGNKDHIRFCPLSDLPMIQMQFYPDSVLSVTAERSSHQTIWPFLKSFSAPRRLSCFGIGTDALSSVSTK